jgi:hypothetical protein
VLLRGLHRGAFANRAQAIAAFAAFVLYGGSGALAQTPSQKERVISADGSFVIKLDWFDASACPKSDKKFYFRVGKQVFASPTNEFVAGRLRNIRSAASTPTGGMNVKLTSTAGCKSDPLGFVQVKLKSNASDPDFFEITETPERSDSEPPVARYIKHLSQTGACRAAKLPDLIACAGSRTDHNGKTIGIVFLIVSESGNKVDIPASGIPIHARCEGDSEVMACSVSDEIENGASVKAVIDQRRISAPQVRQLRQHLRDFAAQRRVS